jgi:hypothetical protein
MKVEKELRNFTQPLEAFINKHQALVEYLDFFSKYRKFINCNVYVSTKYEQTIRCKKCNVPKNTSTIVPWLDPYVITEDNYKVEQFDKYCTTK